MKRSLFILMVVGTLAGTCAQAVPSPRQAFFRSLLVPGWGQRYGGHVRAAGWFAGTELALWGGYVGSRWLAGVREDRYQAYAAAHAGARIRDKDGTFFDDLGFYDSVQEHNLYAAYSEGPSPRLYPNTPEFFWEWDSQESRKHYRHLHNEHGSADRQALYVAGFIALNHVVSAIHAARTVTRSRTVDRPGGDARLPVVQAAFDPLRKEARLVWVRSFR